MAGMDAPRGLAERVIDTKLIKGPQTFNGEKKDWKRWSAKLTGYVSGVDMNLLELMRVAAVQKEVIYLADMAPVHRDASGVLYSVLNGLLEGDSYDILMNVEDGNGAEVWGVKYLNDDGDVVWGSEEEEQEFLEACEEAQNL